MLIDMCTLQIIQIELKIVLNREDKLMTSNHFSNSASNCHYICTINMGHSLNSKAIRI